MSVAVLLAMSLLALNQYLNFIHRRWMATFHAALHTTLARDLAKSQKQIAISLISALVERDMSDSTQSFYPVEIDPAKMN